MPTPTRSRVSRPRRVDVEAIEDDEDIAPFDTDEDAEDDAPPAARKKVEKKAEAPVRRRRAQVEDEPEDEDEDVDSDDEETLAVPYVRGRKAIAESKRTTSGIYFKWPKESGEESILKFLFDEPWKFDQHWVDGSSSPCMGSSCPLCKLGAKLSARIVYDVVNMSAPDGPKMQAFIVGVQIEETLVKLHENKKTGPLTKQCIAVSRSEKPNPTGFDKYSYSFLPVKDRDLEEDYGISLNDLDDALDAADAAGGQIDPEKVIGKVTKKSLQDLADKLMMG